MILDPVLGDSENDDELIEYWRAAIVHNLWPKLISEQPRERKMEISLRHEGRPIDLLPKADPRISAFETCLSAVRSTQADAGGIHPMVTVEEIRCLKPKKLVGHLALMRYPVPPGTPDELTHHVCLMRNEAELVVKYLPQVQIPDSSMGWAGVFKPTAELDPTYAISEPPAHDDWVVQGMAKGTQKTFVNTFFTKSTGIIKDYLAPKAVPVDAAGQVSGGDLSSVLSDLAGSAIGSRPVPRPRASSSGGGGKSQRKVSVKILGTELIGSGPLSGRPTVRVAMSIEGTDRGELVPSRVAWAVEGGRETDREGLLGEPPELILWVINPGTAQERVSRDESVMVVGGDRVTAEILGSRGRALDVDFKVRDLVQ